MYLDEIFETVFQTKNQYVLILRVQLPFPTNDLYLLQPPSMSLVGVRATHSWIDSSMNVVGFRAIASVESWNACRYPLGKVVKEVVQHFQLFPPTILEILDTSVKNIQPSTGTVKSPADIGIVGQSVVRKLPSTTLPPTFEEFVRSSTRASDSKKMDNVKSFNMVCET